MKEDKATPRITGITIHRLSLWTESTVHGTDLRDNTACLNVFMENISIAC